MRVLAAMSGGVDSAVAAARAVDAGHDVVGVHLALSTAPGALRTGSRGCCSKEDAGDARRAADVLGIPFYVWDFADRFKEDVIDDFVAAYAAGQTPNPCLRCNEKIKFSALADRAMALGFDAVATGHYARLEDGVLRRAVDADKDQSYVLAVLTAEQLSRAMFPIGDTPEGPDPRRGRRARSRGGEQAGQPRHLLHSRPVTPGPSSAPASVCGPGKVVDADSGEVLAEHDGVHGFTIGQRKGLGIAGPARRRRSAVRHRDRTRDGHGPCRSAPNDLKVWTSSRRSVRSGPRVGTRRPRRMRGAGPGARRDGAGGRRGVAGSGIEISLREPLTGVAAGQAAVLYRPDPAGDKVLGSGTIAVARPEPRACDDRDRLGGSGPGSPPESGSWPGTDAREAAAVMVGELAELPHLVELPDRGLGADTIGRASALLVDLHLDASTTGYRLVSRRGTIAARAEDLLRAGPRRARGSVGTRRCVGRIARSRCSRPVR